MEAERKKRRGCLMWTKKCDYLPSWTLESSVSSWNARARGRPLKRYNYCTFVAFSIRRVAIYVKADQKGGEGKTWKGNWITA